MSEERLQARYELGVGGERKLKLLLKSTPNKKVHYKIPQNLESQIK